jgi:hypothetical protein
MHVISDKLRCPSDTNTEQCMSYRTSYVVLQILTQNNACHIGQATLSFRYQNRTMLFISDKLRCPSDTNTEQCMWYRKRYVVLHIPTQNNACHFGQATMSFRQQHRIMHVISDKLPCPSDTKTEQCMWFRTSYDVLQRAAQNNACHMGQATISFRH